MYVYFTIAKYIEHETKFTFSELEDLVIGKSLNLLLSHFKDEVLIRHFVYFGHNFEWKSDFCYRMS